MKEIIVLTILTGLCFLSFVVILILGLRKRKRKLIWSALILFVFFCSVTAWTGVRLVSKFYSKVAEFLKLRTGDEIYDALFEGRQTACVKVLHYQDQVVPKMDYAIWLHFETCPAELKRILNRHEFVSETLATNSWEGKIPYGESLEWFNPTRLGDSIMVFEYSTYDSKNIQTIWASLDSTEVFVRDIFD